jgi:hypothetical protein
MATVAAGHGNKISGKHYCGLYEFIEQAWTVDTEIFVQCKRTGDWFRKADEHCNCSDENCPASLVSLVKRAIAAGRVIELVMKPVEN